MYLHSEQIGKHCIILLDRIYTNISLLKERLNRDGQQLPQTIVLSGLVETFQTITRGSVG